MEMMLNTIAPEEGNKYTHTCEGPDDMPAHVKSTLIGNELTLPIHNGKLTLGRWQVRYRTILLTLSFQCRSTAVHHVSWDEKLIHHSFRVCGCVNTETVQGQGRL